METQDPTAQNAATPAPYDATPVAAPASGPAAADAAPAAEQSATPDEPVEVTSMPTFLGFIKPGFWD